jgi:hypothetical protein
MNALGQVTSATLRCRSFQSFQQFVAQLDMLQIDEQGTLPACPPASPTVQLSKQSDVFIHLSEKSFCWMQLQHLYGCANSWAVKFMSYDKVMN